MPQVFGHNFHGLLVINLASPFFSHDIPSFGRYIFSFTFVTRHRAFVHRRLYNNGCHSSNLALETISLVGIGSILQSLLFHLQMSTITTIRDFHLLLPFVTLRNALSPLKNKSLLSIFIISFLLNPVAEENIDNCFSVLLEMFLSRTARPLERLMLARSLGGVSIN